MKFTLCSNAGLSIDTGEVRILVDIIDDVTANHDFSHPHVLCFTHCHEDHFSESVAEKFVDIYPDTKVFIPGNHILSKVSLNAKRHDFFIGETEISFVKLIHEGKKYADIPHYGIIVGAKAGKIFLTGDCKVAGEDIMEGLHNITPDIAVVDFPWVTLERGRKFILNTLKPKKLLVVHFSGTNDDIKLYKELTLKALDKLEGVDVYIMDRPFCCVELNPLRV